MLRPVASREQSPSAMPQRPLIPRPLRAALPILPAMLLLIVLPFPGTVAMRLLCLFFSLSVALVMCYRDARLRTPPPASWGIAIWMLVCISSLAYTKDLVYTMKELQNEVAYAICAFFSFFVLSQRPEGAQLLLRALALGFLSIGAIAMYGWLTHGMHWHEQGASGGVGAFSVYIVTCLPGLFWLWREDASIKWRKAAAILMAFAILLAFLTLQRGVWPALAAEIMVALYLLRKGDRQSTVRRTRIAFATILVICTAALLLANKLRNVDGVAGLIPSAKTFNTPISEQAGTDGDARLPYWPAIIRKISEHPVIGTGFGQEMMKRVYPELVPPNFPALWHAHNVVLNYALQMGIPGAVALLFLFFSIARWYFLSLSRSSAMRSASTAGVMLIVGILLRNQTNDFFRRDLAILFWSLTGIFLASTVQRTRDQ